MPDSEYRASAHKKQRTRARESVRVLVRVLGGVFVSTTEVRRARYIVISLSSFGGTCGVRVCPMSYLYCVCACMYHIYTVCTCVCACVCACACACACACVQVSSKAETHVETIMQMQAAQHRAEQAQDLHDLLLLRQVHVVCGGCNIFQMQYISDAICLRCNTF